MLLQPPPAERVAQRAAWIPPRTPLGLENAGLKSVGQRFRQPPNANPCPPIARTVSPPDCWRAGGSRLACQQPLGKNRHTPAQCNRPPSGITNSGDQLRRSQILPGIPGVLHLEHSAFIRVEKIIPIGDPVCAFRPHVTLRPFCGRWTTAMLFFGSNQLNAIIHTILDSRGSSGN